MPDVQVLATEKAGRRIEVETSHSRLVHEVRLAQRNGRWLASIVTLPSQIWLSPDGCGALTFEAATEEEADRRAAAFIECECVARGHRLVEPSRDAKVHSVPRSARRVPGKFPIRFLHRGRATGGMPRLVREAVTANLSETGIFIATGEVLTRRARISIDLRLPGLSERLEGEVVWSRKVSAPGRPAGMGIRLLGPSTSYRTTIRNLE